jgi:hypothetical protein
VLTDTRSRERHADHGVHLLIAGRQNRARLEAVRVAQPFAARFNALALASPQHTAQRRRE